jgi:hypothetical protein
MSVILVVEPDSRHAAQLAAMARKHLTAELVIADSASRAVAAMADRVPDVLLMSPLLSRQDEATLAAWLRDLGPAAAHVQELTIPILEATPAPVVPKRRGVLSGLRRNRSETVTTDGCGLDEFARQVSAYVTFAYAHRGIAEPVATPAPLCDADPARVPSERDVIRIQTATGDGMGDEEDGWIPIALDDAWKEPQTPTTKRKGRKRGKKPAQDEGALFDPDQCGFAALVAKLNEITDNNHAEQASADTAVPLIAY